MSEPKTFAAETYIVAGLALAIMSADAETVRALNREGDLKRLFENYFELEISDSIIARTVDLMRDVHILEVDDDEFAGRFITVQKTSFSAQFKILAQQVPDSPIDIVLRGREPWINNVYSNAAFWRKLEEPADETLISSGSSEEIPASDRTVTLLDNSVERKELEEGFAELKDALRTNNSVAAELGEDRERIAAEVSASEAGLKAEKIRVGFLRDTVLKVLREISAKLKDRAMELGVDRLVIILEKLLDNLL